MPEPSGTGQAAKICNNMILGISMIAVSEGFVLAEKLGLDPQKLFDIMFQILGPMLVADDLLPGAGTRTDIPGQSRTTSPVSRQRMMLRTEAGATGSGSQGARRP